MTLDVASIHIVLYPQEVLRQVAKPVPQVDEQVRAVARRMLELMHDAPGVGLAAPQVGLPWRLFVANATGQPQDDHVFINPTLTNPSPTLSDYEEGCLSLPEITGTIRRPQTVTIQAIDIEGRSFTLTSDGLPARIWQHEYDHLDGVLIIDRMSMLDRMACQKKCRLLEKEFAAEEKKRKSTKPRSPRSGKP